jgi:hypothetical protein
MSAPLHQRFFSICVALDNFSWGFAVGCCGSVAATDETQASRNPHARTSCTFWVRQQTIFLLAQLVVTDLLSVFVSTDTTLFLEI